MRALVAAEEITIDSWLSEAEERSLANDVLDGLTRPFKELPPKHFLGPVQTVEDLVTIGGAAALRPVANRCEPCRARPVRGLAFGPIRGRI